MSVPRLHNFARTLLTLVIIGYGSLATIVFSSEKVAADSFFSAGNIDENKMHVLLALGRGSSSVNLPSGVILVPGASTVGLTSDVLAQRTFLDLAKLHDGVYRNVTEETRSVSLSPGGVVDFWLYPYNEAGHVVGVRSGWVFLGPYQQPTAVDVLDIPMPVYRNIVYFEHGLLKTKGGDSVSVGALGNFQSIALGGSALRPVKLFSATAKNPLEVSEVKTSCQESGNAILSFKLHSKSIQNEVVTMLDGSNISLSPNEVRVFENIEVPRSQSSYPVSVKTSLTRCLSRVRSLVFDEPDNHVVLLSRNDLNQWLWGGISVEIPPDKPGDHYCITRAPYQLVFQMPECVVAPKYVIRAPALVEPEVGEKSYVDVVLQNTGGNVIGVVEYSVQFKEFLESYISLPDGVTRIERIDEKIMAYYLVSEFQAGQSRGVQIGVTGFEESDREGELIVQIDTQTAVIKILSGMPQTIATPTSTPASTPTISQSPELPSPTAAPETTVTPTQVLQQVQFNSVSEISPCEANAKTWEINFSVIASELQTIEVPLVLLGNTASVKETQVLEFYWQNGKGTYTVHRNKVSIVMLQGDFKQGEQMLSVHASSDISGLSRDALAVGGLPASPLHECAPRASSLHTIGSKAEVSTKSLSSEKGSALGVTDMGHTPSAATETSWPSSQLDVGSIWGSDVSDLSSFAYPAVAYCGVIFAIMLLALWVIVFPRKSRRK